MVGRTNNPVALRAFHLFNLFGFEVKLDLSWLLLALLISWSLGAGWFPSEYPGLSQHAYAWMGIAVAAGVFFSIVFHEFSHSVVARFFGMPIRGITLFIFGGVAELEYVMRAGHCAHRLDLHAVHAVGGDLGKQLHRGGAEQGDGGLLPADVLDLDVFGKQPAVEELDDVVYVEPVQLKPG